MAWGSCDIRQLQKLQEQLNKIQGPQLEAFIYDCSRELAARLLRKVIKRTPVGNPDNWKTKSKPKGYVGGTLRRGWTARTEREAELNTSFGGGSNVREYIDQLHITKTGKIYQIEIINPVHYGIYIEFGHRTRNHKGWVQGKFMLTISEQELDRQSPQILEAKLMKYLGEVFNV